MRQAVRHGASSILKWVSSSLVEKRSPSFKIPSWPSGFLGHRYYGAKRTVQAENVTVQLPIAIRKPAQDALADYLHSTRGLLFLDAEHISRNSPFFLEKLVEKVDVVEDDVCRSVSRFLRYHPINEFELFFESMGLKPSEYADLLPRGMLFLSDCDLLLENYHVLCNYGVERIKMGNIFKEAREIFGYEAGVLKAKIREYEEMGLSKSIMARVIVCSPKILMGDVNLDLVKVIEKLKVLGFECSRIGQQLSGSGNYRWDRILEVLHVFSKMGYSGQELGRLIREHPGLLFEGSGIGTLCLIGLLRKFGSTSDELRAILLQFPQIQVEKFLSNLRQCFLFFMEIDMEAEEIDRIVRSHSLLLGSCTLKKLNSLLIILNVGKKRMCEMVKENPQVLKKWVLGLRVKPIQEHGLGERERLIALEQKTKFLSSLGFVNGSNDMRRALKVFRGKREELQERFDCLVKAGFDRKEVCNMVRASPQILNQTKDVLEMKIDFLINEAKYPLSSLLRFPAFLSFKIERMKLRLSMYNWLENQGVVGRFLALSTIVACSDRAFIDQYVNRHPCGFEVWQNLQKTVISV